MLCSFSGTAEKSINQKQKNHLHAVANVVQHVVVDGLPDVPDGTLHVGRSDDFMGPQRALVGGQDPDLPPGHLLFMDVHRLQETQRRGRVVIDRSRGKAVPLGPLGVDEAVVQQFNEV